MKRIMIFIVIGVLLFGAGIGGGMLVGGWRSETDSGPNVRIPAPGPITSVGEFTVNLAGPGNRIASFTVSLEVLNARVDSMLNSQNWMPRIRNEILLIAKDKVFEDLTRAEGVVQLGEQIRRTLNTILPLTNGEVAIVRVMFETFVLQ